MIHPTTYLVSALFLSTALSQQDYQKTINAALGSDALISCDKAGDEEAVWLRRDDDLDETWNKINFDGSDKYAKTVEGSKLLFLIRETKQTDEGCYACAAANSTQPRQISCVIVLVSPHIEEKGTSQDLEVEEGYSALLTCRASGFPQPTIYWKREDSTIVHFDNAISGPELLLANVKRSASGAYYCIATNDVPPIVSKRIYVWVKYKPQVRVGRSVVEVNQGRDVRLVCRCWTYPKPIISWLYQDVNITNSYKYGLDLEEESDELTTSGLRIQAMEPQDFGTYTCVCNNSMGVNMDSTTVYEYMSPEASKPSGKSAYPNRISPFDTNTDLEGRRRPMPEIVDNSLNELTSAKSSSFPIPTQPSSAPSLCSSPSTQTLIPISIILLILQRLCTDL